MQQIDKKLRNENEVLKKYETGKKQVSYFLDYFIFIS